MVGVGDAAVGDVAEAVQNKLAVVIVEGEIALELVDGPARERLERVLAAAWQASRLPREQTPAHPPLRAASQIGAYAGCSSLAAFASRSREPG